MSVGARCRAAWREFMTRVDGRVAEKQTRTRLLELVGERDLVECILDDAQHALAGTRFTMADMGPAVTVAVCAGVLPGRGLGHFLGLATDAAFTSGGSIEQMARVMCQVHSRGRARSADIAFLAETGVPIWEGLYQVTGKEYVLIALDAYDGRITFETFRDALAEAVGGAARNHPLPRCGGVFPS